MNFDVITVGSAAFDVYISGKDLKPRFLENHNSLLLQDNHTYQVEHSVYEAGGSALSSAITFARQGIKTACITKTGKDHLANQLKIISRFENVSPDLFINKPEHHTDLNIHIVTERNHEIVFKYDNSSKSMRGRDLRFPGLKTRLLYLAELPTDYKLARFLLLWSKANRAQIVLHTNTFHNFKQKHINFILSGLDRLIMPLSFSREFFTETRSPIEQIRQLHSLGVKAVVLYDETEYAYAFEDNTIYETGVYRKINPLDQTGSGYIFAAAYEAAIFSRKNIPEALTMASASAISVMSVIGTRSGILRKPALRTMKTKTSTL